MLALPVLSPGGAGQFCLFGIHRNDLEIRADDEEIELAPGRLALPGFKNNSSFKNARRRNQATIRGSDGSKESLTFWLSEENGGES